MTTAPRLVVLCGGFLLVSCIEVARPAYPDYWPALVARTGGCPELTGAFENRDLDEHAPILLAKWFLLSSDSLASVDRVQFSFDEPGTLRFRYVASDGRILLDRTWREGKDYQCVQGAIEWHGDNFKFIGVLSSNVLRLQRNVRGDLVVRQAEVGGGIVIVVPLYVSDTRWHVYRQLE